MFLQKVDDSNFSEFLSGKLVFLLIGKEGCAACESWVNTLHEFTGDVPEGFSVGKVTLGAGNLTNFKKVHGVWLSHVRELPHNSIWVDGEMRKEWLGGGEIERLLNRMKSVS